LPQTTTNKAINDRLTQTSERARFGHFAHVNKIVALNMA